MNIDDCTVSIEVIEIERVVVLMNCINSSLVIELILSLQYSLHNIKKI